MKVTTDDLGVVAFVLPVAVLGLPAEHVVEGHLRGVLGDQFSGLGLDGIKMLVLAAEIDQAFATDGGRADPFAGGILP